MSNHLQGGRLDISLIQTTALNHLITLLEKCPGPKAIVWDNSLAGPVGLIAKYSILREHSVTKMFPLRAQPLADSNVTHIIFITRPKLHLMDYIAQNIHYDAKNVKSNTKKQYHIFFVPKKSLLCMDRLKHAGIYGSLNLIEEFQCQLFPIDSDIVSMELPSVYREYFIENDPTCLYQAAQALIHLQQLYGRVNGRVFGKGPMAKHVWDLVQRLQKEEKSKSAPKCETNSKIDQIILIDRSIDLITPLATQLTYEGLIDEIFTINNCTATFPSENFLSSEEKSASTSESLNNDDKKQIILNSADKLFADLRDKNFNAVGAYLSKQAKAISAQIDSQNSQDKTVQEMKLYIQRLPQILAKKKALSHHTAIAECIKQCTDDYQFLDTLQTEQEFLNCIETDKVCSYIEDMIAQAKPLIQVLRLIALQCLTNSGLRPKVFEYYKREVCQVYGIEALINFACLEQVGLVKLQTHQRQYSILRKTLKLTMEDTSETCPNDISYVHSVYAPLSVRLCEQVTKKGGWKQLQDVLGLLPGPTIDECPNSGTLNAQQDAPQVVLVFFIGGCTFAEISALRFLSQQEDSNVDFVVATTKLINGNSFLKSIIEEN